MRLLHIANREYKISERDYGRLMKRFNVERALVTLLGYYFISAKLICVGRGRKCSRCPLSDPRKKVNSCTLLFRNILGKELSEYLHFFDNGVLWESRFDNKARQALKILQDTFSEAKKI